MGQECPKNTPDTDSFRATGEHRVWCTDHADDTDGGWCRGGKIHLGDELLAHLTESDREHTFIRIERQVVENGRTCYDDAVMIPLEEAEEVASGLRELIDDATVAPPDECTTNADDTATTGPCECERLFGLDRATDIHDLFKRLHGAVYHVPAARA
jgi:hypothetical protein